MLPRTANYMHEVHLANANRTHYSQDYALQLFIHEGRKSIFSYFKMSQMMNRFCFLAETLQLPVYEPHVFIFCTVFTWILDLSFWWKKTGCFAFDCMCRWISIHLDQILNLKKKKEWKANEPTIIQSSNGQQVDWVGWIPDDAEKVELSTGSFVVISNIDEDPIFLSLLP